MTTHQNHGRRKPMEVDTLPMLRIGTDYVRYIQSFKYLGHIISYDTYDDADIRCEIRNLFFRTNILIRKFSKCTVMVKKNCYLEPTVCAYMTLLYGKRSVLILW